MVTVLLLMPLRVAVTLVVEPEVAVESTAPLPLVIVVMTAVLLLLQVTWLVMSCCCALPLKVPKAVKTTVCPAAGLGVVVLMAMAVSGPVFTVTVELAVMVPEVAVMVAVPGGVAMVVAAVTRPPLLTVATSVAELVQLALPVKSLVLPSLKLPVALICCVPPSMSDAEVGATVIEVSVGFTKKPLQPAARDNRDKAANVAKKRRFRLRKGMIKEAPADALFMDFPLEVAIKNCSREGFGRNERCTSVCTKVCAATPLPNRMFTGVCGVQVHPPDHITVC